MTGKKCHVSNRICELLQDMKHVHGMIKCKSPKLHRQHTQGQTVFREMIKFDLKGSTDKYYHQVLIPSNLFSVMQLFRM